MSDITPDNRVVTSYTFDDGSGVGWTVEGHIDGPTVVFDDFPHISVDLDDGGQILSLCIALDPARPVRHGSIERYVEDGVMVWNVLLDPSSLGSYQPGTYRADGTRADQVSMRLEHDHDQVRMILTSILTT